MRISRLLITTALVSAVAASGAYAKPNYAKMKAFTEKSHEEQVKIIEERDAKLKKRLESMPEAKRAKAAEKSEKWTSLSVDEKIKLMKDRVSKLEDRKEKRADKATTASNRQGAAKNKKNEKRAESAKN